MCVTDRHDMTLAVKVALNLNTTNQSAFLVDIFCESMFTLSQDQNFIFDRIECVLAEKKKKNDYVCYL